MSFVASCYLKFTFPKTFLCLILYCLPHKAISIVNLNNNNFKGKKAFDIRLYLCAVDSNC